MVSFETKSRYVSVHVLPGWVALAPFQHRSHKPDDTQPFMSFMSPFRAGLLRRLLPPGGSLCIVIHSFGHHWLSSSSPSHHRRPLRVAAGRKPLARRGQCQAGCSRGCSCVPCAGRLVCACAVVRGARFWFSAALARFGVVGARFGRRPLGGAVYRRLFLGSRGRFLLCARRWPLGGAASRRRFWAAGAVSVSCPSVAWRAALASCEPWGARLAGRGLRGGP